MTETEVGEQEPEPLILPQAIGAMRSYLAYLLEHHPNSKHIESLKRVIDRYDRTYDKNASGNSTK